MLLIYTQGGKEELLIHIAMESISLEVCQVRAGIVFIFALPHQALERRRM
jgi:hypothetical protein